MAIPSEGTSHQASDRVCQRHVDDLGATMCDYHVLPVRHGLNGGDAKSEAQYPIEVNRTASWPAHDFNAKDLSM